MNRGKKPMSDAQPLAVLHVISGLSIGGAEMMLLKLLQTTEPGAARAGVLSLSEGGVLADDIRAQGLPLWHIAMPGGFPSPGFSRRFRAVVEEFKPDVVMAWMYRANAVCSQLVPRRIPVIWNVRQSLDHNSSQRLLFRFTRRVNLWISGRPRMVIYNSRASHQQHLEFGFRAAEQRVIPNGFDLDRFQPQPEARARLRGEWGVAEGDLVFGIVGRFHPIKDHLGFIRAAGLAVLQEPEGGARMVFVMVGRGLDRDNDKLMAEIRAAGIEERVHLLGEQRDLPGLYSAFDVQVSASLVEAFPNVLGEAMACGLPCVATAVGDSAWVVGDTGRVVEPERPQQLAQAMVELAKLAPEERRALGAAARTRVQQEFGIASVAQRFLEAQREATGRQAGKPPSRRGDKLAGPGTNPSDFPGPS
ncbi:MAG: glycosyltransferase [Spirochaetaceae bacterium]|nr:MAG: glycosyltransferase [Spirochaetaceae bacterium]